MKFDVRWTEVALRDFERTLDFLDVESPQSAAQLIDSIDDAVSSLRSLPDRGRWVPELERLGIRAYRELVVGVQRVVYRVEASGCVFVVAVLDGRRDLETILSARLLDV